jgi:predicted DNA-binding transcriptional regulator AlpA
MYTDSDHRHGAGDRDQLNASLDSNQHCDEILTIDEVSARKKVPKSWLYARTRERAADGIPHLKCGKYVRFIASDVDAYFLGMRRR